ncbi:hypothetical protein [Streptomyces sp. NPDC006274]|uniref:allophanate hydrolase-related protein n=1 Tax=unclassified Streptomyces TaxID=2593676 RepID=UPI00339FBEB8
MTLGHELRAPGGTLHSTTAAGPVYRPHALRTDPPKPGLLHTGPGGISIEAELRNSRPGGLAALPRPMTVGGVEVPCLRVS